MTKSVLLPDAQRSDFLQQWARMDGAGIPADQMAATLASAAGDRYRPLFENFRRGLAAGSAPASAARSAGLLRDWEAKVIGATYEAGRLESGLRLLADECSARVARWRKIKSRLALPVVILVLASFLAPLPRLIAGTISFAGFVLHALGLPTLLIASVILIRHLVEQQNAASEGIGGAVLKVPVIGRLTDLRTKRDYVSVLALALRSGIPAFEALPLARSAVTNRALATSFAAAESLVLGGETMADALQQSGVFDNETGYAFATTGQYAGSLDDMLERYARLLDEKTTSYADQAAEWVPRVIYLLIAGLMAVEILGFWTGYIATAGESG